MSRLFIAIFLSTLLGGITLGQASEEREAGNKALIQSKFDAWASGTGGPYELLAGGT